LANIKGSTSSLFSLSWPVSFIKNLLNCSNHSTQSHTSIAKWLAAFLIVLFSIPSLAQDKPKDNKKKIKEAREWSTKRKEKATTKDISGKRIRTKNKNSTAGRAIYSNPSPYKKKIRTGKDRASKPIGNRIRSLSRTPEVARNNVYPQQGPFVNRASKKTETAAKSRFTRSGKLSAKRTATSGASDAYPQKGPFVNRPSKNTQGVGKSPFTRKAKLSVGSRSAESSRGRFFRQTGPFVNRQSRSTENVAARSGYTRTGKLSAGPKPPGKKKRVVPRSESQQFLTRGKKNVYWGKFSKGERPITTDVTGKPLRKRNFQTPANPVIQAKDPYEGRTRTGDRAYSGTFRSGHSSASKKIERPWRGDVSGNAIRKRKERQNQVAGERVGTTRRPGGLSAKIQSSLDRRRGIKPDKKGGGSISGKIRSNKPIGPKAPGLGAMIQARSQNKMTGKRPVKGGGGSISGKFQSNKPIGAKAPGIGATLQARSQNKMTGKRPVKGGGGSVSGKFLTNKPIGAKAPGIGATLQARSQNKMTGKRPVKGGGGSISGKFQSNKPLGAKPPGILANKLARYQSKLNQNKSAKKFEQGGLNFHRNNGADRARKGKLAPSEGAAWNNSNRPLPSVDYSGASRLSAIVRGNKKSASGKLWNNQNKPIGARPPGIQANKLAKYQSKLNNNTSAKKFEQGGLNFHRNNGADRVRKGKLGPSERGAWNNNNRPLPSIDYSKGSVLSSIFKSNKKSASGVLWNNDEKPLIGRTPPKGANQVEYSGKIKRQSYVKAPHSVELALKTKKPSEKVFMTDGLQARIKAKQTGTKPKAVKGSLPGVKPSSATVKASEYARSMKVYWDYKHNPNSAEGAQKTIAPTKAFNRASAYSGKARLTKNYRHNPASHRDALKVIAPGRAYARVTDYQGNVKMHKYNTKKSMPDAKFAHMKGNNVKGERTILTDVKLLWAKIFKKNADQPPAVKQKGGRPRYDKREKELWPGLYD
jgi:hypothetical protein